MMLKRFIITLFTSISLFSCVGQKEDSSIFPEEKKEEEEKKTGTKFFRRILATEFTATWCVYCPDMKESISRISESHPGRIVEMAVHYADGMDCPVGDSLTELFAVEAWPTVVFNLNPEWRTTSISSTIHNTYIGAIFSQTSSVCGIKAKSILVENNLTATISVIAPEDGLFILQTAILENDIIAHQTGKGNNYHHNSVLRAVPQTCYLNLNNNTEQSLSFEYRIPREHSPDKTVIIAYLINAYNSTINNVIKFEAGSDIEYEYEVTE